MKIKLCGITREEEIQEVNRLRPDYIGFVFYPPSRRSLSPERAAVLKHLLDPGIRAVGVFVNAAPEHVADLLGKGVIDAAQLHGQEDAAYLQTLRRLTDHPLFQAFRVTGKADLSRAEQSQADLLLLDSGMGSGLPFDWDLLVGFPRPYLLAGGLHPGNAAEAVSRLHPYGLDVSSGIETEGHKDLAKMRQFVKNARDAEEAREKQPLRFAPGTI